MKRWIAVLLGMICVLSGYALSKDEIVKQMRENGSYEGKYIGIEGSLSKQYALYESLAKVCTDRELIQLLKDDCDAVRIYACMGLGQRNCKYDWLSFAVSELKDYKKILESSFDMGRIMYVGDIMIMIALDNLSENEKKQLSLKAVQEKSNLIFASQVLMGEEMSEELYKAEREWALEGNDMAIFSLAKYKKNADRDLILSLKEKSPMLFFRTCEYNLDASLKPFFAEYMESILPKKYYSGTWLYFYKAVAKYHDEFSKQIFSQIFTDKVNKDIQKYHLKYIFEAVKTYSDGFYDDLIKKLWFDFNLVDENVIEYFYKKDKTVAIEGLKKSLQKSDQMYAATDVLDYVIKKLVADEQDIKKEFLEALKKNSVSTFDVFMNNIYAFPKGDKDIVETLKKRLKSEDNGYVLIPIYEYFLSLEDEAITGYLQKSFDSNKGHYMSWVQRELKSLLKKGNKK